MNTKFTGGAQLGNARASWPLVQLRITPFVLTIDGGLIGTVVFRPQDVTTLETNGNTLRIVHTVKEYKQNISFTSAKQASEIVKQIQRSGFLHNPEPVPQEIDRLVRAMQESGAFPVKKSAAIVIGLIWNLLILLPIINFVLGDMTKVPFREIFILAPAFMLILCVLLLTAKPVQQLILKEGRSAEGGLRPALFFMMAIFTIFIIVGLTSAPQI